MAGRYSVGLELNERVTTYVVRATHPRHHNAQAHVRLAEVRDRETLKLDLVMEPLGDVAKVEGFILNQRGEPLSGQPVYLRSDSLKKGYGASSDADGRFVLDNVPVGNDYHLRVQPEHAYKDFTLDSVEVWKDAPELEILLEPLATGFMRGTMVDPDSAPIPGFTLRVWSNEATGFFLEVTSDDTGRFELEEAPAGELTFQTGSAPRLIVRGTKLEPRSTTDVVLVLDWGEHRVSGTVLDEDRRPAASATVRLSWSHTKGGLNSSSSRQTKTDAAGRFFFSALAPGAHRITASDAEGSKTSPVTYEVGSNAPEPVLELRARGKP